MGSNLPVEGVLLVDGILVTGTHPQCGKTVVTAGLGAAMRNNGIQVQTIRPINFRQLEIGKPYPDQVYLDRVMQPLHVSDGLIIETPYDMTNIEWNRLTHLCRKLAYPGLIELPGSVASPLAMIDGTIRDVCDLARELGCPVLLVTPKSPHLIANIVPSLVYLKSRQVSTIGWVGVEAYANINAPAWETDALQVAHQYLVPYLGTLGFSPSISVENSNQGNLIRQTEDGIDLLPIEMALQTHLPENQR